MDMGGDALLDIMKVVWSDLLVAVDAHGGKL
jgi:hypothetical protein